MAGKASAAAKKIKTQPISEGSSIQADFSTASPPIQMLQGDSRVLLPTLAANHSAQLVFCDPPFNIGQSYNEFRDDIPICDYWEFTRTWWQAAASLVASNGTLACHVPDAVTEQILRHWPAWATEAGIQIERTDWVIWHYRFGQCGESKWISSKTHLLIFQRPQGGVWNAADVMVPSDRVKYGDSRTTRRADSTTAPAGMRVPLDVWDEFPRVQGNNKERWCKKTGAPFDHPNQLPEGYISRIIKAYTNRKDLVVDPFCGSGTVPTVCRRLRRRCISIDCSKQSLASAFERVKRGTVSV